MRKFPKEKKDWNHKKGFEYPFQKLPFNYLQIFHKITS